MSPTNSTPRLRVLLCTAGSPQVGVPGRGAVSSQSRALWGHVAAGRGLCAPRTRPDLPRCSHTFPGGRAQRSCPGAESCPRVSKSRSACGAQAGMDTSSHTHCLVPGHWAWAVVWDSGVSGDRPPPPGRPSSSCQTTPPTPRSVPRQQVSSHAAPGAQAQPQAQQAPLGCPGLGSLGILKSRAMSLTSDLCPSLASQAGGGDGSFLTFS